MYCFISPSSDVFFNLAAEEFFLKSNQYDMLFLYRNEPAVVIGKHQNTWAEVNHSFIQKRTIKVARRLSGGGTVFHDAGNINFSFILTGAEGRLVDFRKYAMPVLQYVRSLGVDAYFSPRNDMFVNELKFSGNAEHIFRNRVLHHGTLLYNSELHALQQAITQRGGKFEHRAVASVRSKVTNIAPLLNNPPDVTTFTHNLLQYCMAQLDNALPYHLSDADIQAINNLIQTKYNTWEWNVGYSPAYRLTKNIQVQQLDLLVDINVEKGTIKKAHIETALFDATAIIPLLQGCRHEYETIFLLLQTILPTHTAHDAVDAFF